LLLAATVRSFAHMPLGISDRNSTLFNQSNIAYYSTHYRNLFNQTDSSLYATTRYNQRGGVRESQRFVLHVNLRRLLPHQTVTSF